MSTVHICAPAPTDESFRVLRKRGRIFEGGPFDTWEAAFRYGVAHFKDGFRVFHQRGYEWYDPTNTEIIKVSGDLEKEVVFGDQAQPTVGDSEVDQIMGQGETP